MLKHIIACVREAAPNLSHTQSLTDICVRAVLHNKLRAVMEDISTAEVTSSRQAATIPAAAAATVLCYTSKYRMLFGMLVRS